MSETEFRIAFIKQLRHVLDHTIIETNTSRGVPDMNLCYEGVDAWLELKLFVGGRVLLRPEQYAWGTRRAFHKGRAFVGALHPNNRIHFFRFPFDVIPHSKYLSIVSKPEICDIKNVDAILSLLFT